MTFRIGGWDFSDVPIQGGLIATKVDFESSLTQRSKYDGSLYYKVLRTYYTLELTTCPLLDHRYNAFLAALEMDEGAPEITFSVSGIDITRRFRCKERPTPAKMGGWVASTALMFEEV